MPGLLTHRRTRSRRHAGGHAHVNVTPLIDIVMVLIIFYLMVGSLISSDYSELPLPFSMQGAPASATDVYTINIVSTTSPVGAPGPGASPQALPAAKATMVVQGNEIDASSLTRDLAARIAKDPALVIQLRAARDLPYRAVEPAVKAAAKAGATTIRLVTERAP